MKEFHNTLLPWVVAITAFALAAFLSKAYEVLGLGYLLVSIILVFLVLVANSWAVARATSNKIVALVAEKLCLIESVNHGDASTLGLKTNEAMAKLELEVDSREIVLLSPSLANDTGDAKYIGMIKHNIGRNIKYTYILPNTESIKARSEDLKILFSEKKNLLRIIYLPEKVFLSLTHSHVVIYYPEKGGRRVFMELPMMHNNVNWWVEMGKEYSSLFYNQLRSVIKQHRYK